MTDEKNPNPTQIEAMVSKWDRCIDQFRTRLGIEPLGEQRMENMTVERSWEKEECPHNEGVWCARCRNDCDKCGWNPEVVKARLRKIYRGQNWTLPDYLK